MTKRATRPHVRLRSERYFECTVRLTVKSMLIVCIPINSLPWLPSSRVELHKQVQSSTVAYSVTNTIVYLAHVAIDTALPVKVKRLMFGSAISLKNCCPAHTS